MAFNVGELVGKMKLDLSGFKKGINDAKSSVQSAAKTMKSGFSSINQAIQNNAASIQRMSLGFAAAGAAAGVTVKGWTDAFIEQENAEIKLSNTMKQRTGATDEVIDAMKRQAAETQNLGVVGDEALIAGQANLATYALTYENINKLTPAMADLAVKQGGVAAGAREAEAAADKLGKVLDGDVGALKDAGVSFSEMQAEILKTGNETDRVNTLMDILSENGITGLNEAIRNTTSGSLKDSANAWGDFKELMGGAIAPAIEQIAGLVKDLSMWLQGLSPEVKTFVGYGVLAVAVFGGIIAPLLLFISLIPAMSAGFVTLGGILATIFSPITLIIGLIVGVAALIYVFRDEIAAVFVYVGEKIGEFFVWVGEKLSQFGAWIYEVIGSVPGLFSSAWSAALGYVQQFLDWLGSVFVGMFTGFVDWIMATLDGLAMLWEMAWDGISMTFQMIWEGIKEFFMAWFQMVTEKITSFFLFLKEGFLALWSAIKESAKMFIDAFIASVSFLWESVKGLFVAAKNALIATITGLWDGIKGLFSSGKDFIGQAWGNAMEGMKNTAVSIWENIKETVKSGINWMIAKINWLIRAANNVSSKFGFSKMNEIPALAAGGIVTRPTLAMIGEGGEPEAVIPLSKMSETLGVSGAGGVNIHIHDSVITDQDAAIEMLNRAMNVLRPNLGV